MQTNIQRAATLLIEKYTPESAEVSADIHIGVTGLPAPGAAKPQKKPVGTMFIHPIKNWERFFTDRKVFSRSPEGIILHTVDRPGALLAQHLSKS